MRPAPRVPLGLRLAVRLLPLDVRGEVLRELLEQYAGRREAHGRAAAWRWALAQPLAAWRARDPRTPDGAWRGLARDLALVPRTLRRRSALALSVVATIALAVASVSAMTSVVDAVLLRPLPFPDAGQVVWLGSHQIGPGRAPFDPATAARAHANPLDVVEWQRRERHLAALTPFETFESTLRAADRPIRVDVASVRAEIAEVFGVPARHGRLFRKADEAVGVNVVVLSHGLWRTAFGGDPAIVGRAVDLAGASFEVIGVLPDLPIDLPVPGIDLWMPMRPLAPGFSNRGGVWQRVIARVDAGVSLSQAQDDLTRIARELAEEHPVTNETRRVAVVPFREGFVGSTDAVLRLVTLAVLLVLAIASANVGQLLFIGAQARRRELAVRAALGAGVWRLARLLIAEAVCLAAAGGVIGLLLAPWLLRGFLQLYPDRIPAVGEIAIGTNALLAAFGSTGLAAVLAILPSVASLRGSRGRQLHADMRSGDRGMEQRGQRRGRAALVIMQVALSMALLVGAGLLLRTFLTMRSTDAGLDAGDRVLTFNLALGEARYPALADEVRFYDALFERLRALPGVDHAGATTLLPFTPGEFIDGFTRPGYDDRAPNVPIARLQNVTAGYLEAIGLPVRTGRTIQPTDTAASPPVVVVNAQLEREYFPDGALGRQIRFRGEIAEIVGVVGDKRHRSLREQPRADMYFPRAQSAHPRYFAWVALRTSGDPAALAPLVRSAVASLDPGVAADDVATMAERRDEALAPDRFRAWLVGALAAMALGLAALGVYGLVSFTVTREARSIAIRMALGATAGGTAGRVVRSAVLLTVVGLALGLALAASGRELVASFLFGVTPLDAATTAAAALALIAVAAAAALGPALRASRVDPVTTLRADL